MAKVTFRITKITFNLKVTSPLYGERVFHSINAKRTEIHSWWNKKKNREELVHYIRDRDNGLFYDKNTLQQIQYPDSQLLAEEYSRYKEDDLLIKDIYQAVFTFGEEYVKENRKDFEDILGHKIIFSNEIEDPENDATVVIQTTRGKWKKVQEEPEKPQPLDETVKSYIEEMVLQQTSKSKKAQKAQKAQKKVPTATSRRIPDIEIPATGAGLHALRQNGILTLRSLLYYSEEKLLAMNGIGPRTLERARAWAKRHGQELGKNMHGRVSFTK